MSPLWSSGLVALALLSSGVVYGVDVFFALIARTALRRVDAASLTQVLGHLHAVADARMPVFGVAALLSTGGLCWVAGGWATLPGRLTLLALAGLLTQLAAYALVAQPVNQRQTAAARQGQTPPDARALQDRWDSVIGLRAGALTVAVAALIGVALHLPR
ncbi:DUF1772 domain-containing protein [Hymenobacter coccineus]|uniref:DUF1772 domain-containing protein n=1 Tax=Hymenobacter coccineus TaxID=1908235 RepID=A0A1G1TLE3_9BACT|nr:DUF1772 domain-containing protein [Hymenobacter coccineus]OGX91708.1 hypothetical protein BEN49_18825 [Hymenobacter coccineus]